VSKTAREFSYPFKERSRTNEFSLPREIRKKEKEKEVRLPAWRGREEGGGRW